MSLLESFVELIKANHHQEIDDLLSLILAKLRRETAAEGGSIYKVDPIWPQPYQLEACSMQNDKLTDVSTEKFYIPLNETSIAGHVAVTGETVEIDDLYALDPSLPFEFNSEFDRKHHYKSISMLAFPLKNFHDQVIGVVQLVNHISSVDGEGNPNYEPFPAREVERMESVATMIGAMVERTALVKEMDRLRKIVGPNA